MTCNLTNVSSYVRESRDLSWNNVLTGLVLYVIVVISFSGNVLVLLAICKEKALQTDFNCLIINLAITDAAVAVTGMFFCATEKMLGYWPFGKVLCGIWIFCDYGLTFASVFTLLAISGDRFWSVFWGLIYRSVNKKKKSVIMISIIWSVMLAMWLPALIVDRLTNLQVPRVCFWDPELNREFVVILAVIGHHGPCLLMLYFYFRIFFYFRTRLKLPPLIKKNKNRVVPVSTRLPETSYVNTGLDNDGIQSVTQGTSLSPSVSPKDPASSTNGDANVSTFSPVKLMNDDEKQTRDTQHSVIKTSNSLQKRARRDMRVFIVLTHIIIAYVVCWVPFHFIYDIMAVNRELVPPLVFDITFWLTYINSTINPFLYTFSSPEFRCAFRRIILRKSRNDRITSSTQRSQSV